MRKSIWLLALLPLLSIASTGCASTMQGAAFEPRSFPFIPELGAIDQNPSIDPNIVAVVPGTPGAGGATVQR